MRFTAKTEEEVSQLLEPGIVDFEVLKSEEKDSKSGKRMFHFLLKLYDNNGKSGIANDYILETFDWKLRHFAYCGTGLENQYENGELEDSECVGKCGKAKIKIEKDKTGNYPDKNVIVDYVINGNGAEKKQQPAGEPIVDDDIPF